MSEFVALGMVCTCGESGILKAAEVRSAHPDWTVETAFFALGDIGGPVTIDSDMWFRVTVAVHWVHDGNERDFKISVECDKLLVGAVRLYDELAKMWKDWTGEAYDG